MTQPVAVPVVSVSTGESSKYETDTRKGSENRNQHRTKTEIVLVNIISIL